MRDSLLYNVTNINETPYGVIKVVSNSNYYYLKTFDSTFVVLEFTSLIQIDPIKNIAKYIKNYYNVLTGDIVLTINYTYTLDGNLIYSDNKNCKLISLSEILNIKDNDYYTLDENDINCITNFKEEKSKNPRKYYF